MNFLAHLYLCEPTPASMIGNLLPDLVRGKLPDGLDAEVLAGVKNHRRVDAFTDTHPIFHRSRACLRSRHGRYAGILVDVFYDHFLAANWETYHPRPLTDFLDAAHGVLISDKHETRIMPQAMQPVAQMMAREQWMSWYASLDGVHMTLTRMSRRMSQRFGRAVHLERAVLDLEAHYEHLASDFHAFFPELMRYIGIDHRPDEDQGSNGSAQAIREVA